MNIVAIIFASLSGVSLGTIVYLVIAYVKANKNLNTQFAATMQLREAYDELLLNYTVQSSNLKTLEEVNKNQQDRIALETELRKKVEKQRDENFKHWAKNLPPNELATHFNELLQKLSKTDSTPTATTSDH